MDATEYANVQVRDAIVDDRLLAIETYLAALITDKYPDIFQNFDYGNYKSTVRHETMRADRIYASDTAGIYNIDFNVKIAGPTDLIDQTGGTFDIQMPANVTGSDIGFPLWEIRRFDPATEAGELESVLGTINEIAQSSNTFPEYDRLLDDDSLDITVWAGYDYTEDRIDLWASMRSWLALFAEGFEMQADGDYVDVEDMDQEVYDEVVETMGIYYPGSITDFSIELFARMKSDTVFSKQVFYKNRAITINVKLRHRNLYEGNNSLLKTEFLDEVVSSDILIYNGHAGPYYGWYLGPENDAFIGVDAVAELTMDPNRYQIMIISGCQTYSTYAEHFYRNPAKNTNNLDVITTVNWIQLSHGERSINSILRFFVADTDGDYRVFSYGQILNYPNTDVFETDAFWATQGTNDNPVVNPLANVASFGTSCSADEDCGSTPENRCARGECSVQSMSGYVCPEGYDFIDPWSVWGAYCAPADGVDDVVEVVACPNSVFGDGNMYDSNVVYGPNQCSVEGATCANIYFYETASREEALCENGVWIDSANAGQTTNETGGETDGQTGGETGGETGGDTGGETGGDTGGEVVACPNSVFGDGNMYDSNVVYGPNQCSVEGATCANIYFYETASREEALCENGAWIDSANAGQSTGGETGGDTNDETSGETDSETGGETNGETSDETNGQTELCPNTVFTNGFIYNGNLEYVNNSCSAEGQVCTTTTYFSSESAHLPATCQNGQWEISE